MDHKAFPYRHIPAPVICALMLGSLLADVGTRRTLMIVAIVIDILWAIAVCIISVTRPEYTWASVRSMMRRSIISLIILTLLAVISVILFSILHTSGEEARWVVLFIFLISLIPLVMEAWTCFSAFQYYRRHPNALDMIYRIPDLDDSDMRIVLENIAIAVEKSNGQRRPYQRQEVLAQLQKLNLDPSKFEVVTVELVYPSQINGVLLSLSSLIGECCLFSKAGYFTLKKTGLQDITQTEIQKCNAFFRDLMTGNPPTDLRSLYVFYLSLANGRNATSRTTIDMCKYAPDSEDVKAWMVRRETVQDTSKLKCKKCNERVLSYSIIPCGHVLCEVCSKEAKACPLCGGTVSSIVRICL